MRPRRLLLVGLLALALALAGCLSPGAEDTSEDDTELAGASASPAQPAPTEAHLTANRTDGTAPVTVAFTLEASANASAWTLATGDGATLEGDELPANETHTYEDAGNHTATFTLDEAEARDTVTIHVQAADANTTDEDGGEDEDRDEDDEESEGSDDGRERADEAPDCLRLVPEPADPQGMATGWETRTLEVAFAVDQGFVDHHEDWRTVAQEHVRAVSAIYEDAIAVDVSPVHIIRLPEDATVENASTGETLTDLKAYYDEHHSGLERDAVYLFSGYDLSNAAGQAACIGGAGFTDDAYAVGEADPAAIEMAGAATFGADKAVKVAAHEIGHLLAAHHHQANCAEAAVNYDPARPADACTIMINDLTFINPTFSTPNKLVMRGHVETITGGGDGGIA